MRLKFARMSAQTFKRVRFVSGHTLAMSLSTLDSRARLERYDTIVIGAGQAGLAVGYHLARHDVDFLILEASTRVGERWRSRWDSLRVFTSAAYTSLPGMRFPAAPSYRPHKDELADYLERYADHFDLPIRFDTTVRSVRRDAGHYIIETDEVRYIARNVVIATGLAHAPRIPMLSKSLTPDIVQLHSSAYRNPFLLPEGPALIVGMGNAGARIALEVSRFRPTILAGATRRHWPSRVLGRDIHWWLWPVVSRLTTNSRIGRRFRDITTTDPLVGVSEADLRRAGVERVARVTDVQSGQPMAGNRLLHVKSVVWCTGFAADFGWIDVPIPMERGQPRTRRGAVDGAPGLFLIGYRFLHSLASSLIGGVGMDAAYIAQAIAGAESPREQRH